MQTVATVIGRGHSGTRAVVDWLRVAGFDIGSNLNNSNDRMPFDRCYDAARIIMRYCRHTGGNNWDFNRLHTMPIDPAWKRAMEDYLSGVLAHRGLTAWKLPETVFSYPWLVREFPEFRYVVLYRDPRDTIIKNHGTDALPEWGPEWEIPGGDYERRALSWVFQHRLIRSTPIPQHHTSFRLRDFVHSQPTVRANTARCLGLDGMPPYPGKPQVLGRYRRQAPYSKKVVNLLAPHVGEFDPGNLDLIL